MFSRGHMAGVQSESPPPGGDCLIQLNGEQQNPLTVLEKLLGDLVDCTVKMDQPDFDLIPHREKSLDDGRSIPVIFTVSFRSICMTS